MNVPWTEPATTITADLPVTGPAGKMLNVRLETTELSVPAHPGSSETHSQPADSPGDNRQTLSDSPGSEGTLIRTFSSSRRIDFRI